MDRYTPHSLDTRVSEISRFSQELPTTFATSSKTVGFSVFEFVFPSLRPNFDNLRPRCPAANPDYFGHTQVVLRTTTFFASATSLLLEIDQLPKCRRGYSLDIWRHSLAGPRYHTAEAWASFFTLRTCFANYSRQMSAGIWSPFWRVSTFQIWGLSLVHIFLLGKWRSADADSDLVGDSNWRQVQRTFSGLMEWLGLLSACYGS